MKGIKVARIIFGILFILTALLAIISFAAYFYYGARDMSADASGGGPVGLPYMLAMLGGYAVGMYAGHKFKFGLFKKTECTGSCFR